MSRQAKKIIISGGGTGGHIFPAISIANELRKREPETEILFVGAANRMEMDRVPAAGYEIVGLPVAGFQRKITLKNLVVIYKLFKSLRKAKKIISRFKPDVAIGVGGYASGPVLRMANSKGIPTVLQEQNSYAGVTNKLLAQKAKVICVAYSNMEKYFPKDKIVITGNPIRQDILYDINKIEARKHFDIPNEIPVVLILGGSLGARSINEAVLHNLEKLAQLNAHIIWQTGKLYFEQAGAMAQKTAHQNLKICDFIARMDLAYHISSIVVSRAGAGTISELQALGKACVLIPSPNVAEDHQTKNAQALVNQKAAIMVKDPEAKEKLLPQIEALLANKDMRDELAINCGKMGKPDAAKDIVDEIYKVLK
ncbi:MAG: undecaprenyldiphospho-muramoylpentapeptide beta-N-acetylglucosaminyltransferase [Bacteroidetes bacterium]|jgi:UDP-N-acetylglucosamine--N-acetylmuramyl-(pentapeptide) pyrophosphoryl-undecaprenol N-acetylglucosamine transferase|nr:undecaprenyldiphospho-muramoylpentapeptide beta-N-acetylglucosaminyltransferase [Bacteroidota bacterium]